MSKNSSAFGVQGNIYPGAIELDIGKYEFGRITIDGVRYHRDLVILTDGRVRKRKKKLSKGEPGHTPLSKREMKRYLEAGTPSVFVIGTGKYGSLPIKEGAKKLAEKRGMELICEDTPSAVTTYLGLLSAGEDAALLIHLTC